MKHRNLAFISCLLLASTVLQAEKLEFLNTTKIEPKTLPEKTLTSKKPIIKEVNMPLMICKGFPICQDKIELSLEEEVEYMTGGQVFDRV